MRIVVNAFEFLGRRVPFVSLLLDRISMMNNMKLQIPSDVWFFLDWTIMELQIPLTRPRSPKLGRKSTSSKVLDSSSYRPSANTKSPKCVVEKNKQSSNRSVTSRSQKNAHENASPNIQSWASERQRICCRSVDWPITNWSYFCIYTSGGVCDLCWGLLLASSRKFCRILFCGNI